MNPSPHPPEPRSFTPEEIEAWLDGELPAAEAALLDQAAAHDASLRARREQHARLGALLRCEFAPAEDIPYADFFMHRLERQLDEVRAELEPTAAPAPAQPFRGAFWLNWLPWGLTAATAAALAITLIRPEDPAVSGPIIAATAAPSSASLTLLTAYSPQAEIRSSPEQSQGAVLLVLDGLPEYRGEIRGAGQRLSQRNHRSGELPVGDDSQLAANGPFQPAL